MLVINRKISKGLALVLVPVIIRMLSCKKRKKVDHIRFGDINNMQIHSFPWAGRVDLNDDGKDDLEFGISPQSMGPLKMSRRWITCLHKDIWLQSTLSRDTFFRHYSGPYIQPSPYKQKNYSITESCFRKSANDTIIGYKTNLRLIYAGENDWLTHESPFHNGTFPRDESSNVCSGSGKVTNNDTVSIFCTVVIETCYPAYSPKRPFVGFKIRDKKRDRLGWLYFEGAENKFAISP